MAKKSLKNRVKYDPKNRTKPKKRNSAPNFGSIVNRLNLNEKRALGIPFTQKDIDDDRRLRSLARKQGNLKKLEDGALVNVNNVVFTPEEKKALENLVRRANKKRLDMLIEEANLPRLVGGRDSGDTILSLQAMGRESDFILARKSASLQRFKSKEEFDNYLDNLKRVLSPTYLEDRVKLYKRGHMKALENAFGDEAKDVIMKIRMMKPREYMRKIQSDEFLDISYVYDPSSQSGRLNQIRASLGMKLKEEAFN